MPFSKDNGIQQAKEWEGIWKNRPFDNSNGLACQGAFALFYFLREMRPKPEVVIEVGTWRGFSTWVIRQALPEARIICSDPILASRQFLNQSLFQPEYRLSDVEYTWQDFSNIDINVPNGMQDKVVVFFDDHQNKIPRVEQAREKGIKHIIFDDNVPYDYTHTSFEWLFKKNPKSKSEILKNFSRYEIFPPLFSVEIKNNYMGGVFEDGFSEKIPDLFSSKSSYTWVTKVEL